MSAETFAARAAVIDEGTRRSLFHMLRTMFPHRNVPDGPYERTVDALLADAAASPRLTGLLAQGARDLEALGGKPFEQLEANEAYGLLERIQATPFFAAVKAKAISTFYNDQQVWEAVGYEGPSFDLGGYVSRGFDDLDWLPDVPV